MLTLSPLLYLDVNLSRTVSFAEFSSCWCLMTWKHWIFHRLGLECVKLSDYNSKCHLTDLGICILPLFLPSSRYKITASLSQLSLTLFLLLKAWYKILMENLIYTKPFSWFKFEVKNYQSLQAAFGWTTQLLFWRVEWLTLEKQLVFSAYRCTTWSGARGWTAADAVLAYVAHDDISLLGGGGGWNWRLLLLPSQTFPFLLCFFCFQEFIF